MRRPAAVTTAVAVAAGLGGAAIGLNSAKHAEKRPVVEAPAVGVESRDSMQDGAFRVGTARP